MSPRLAATLAFIVSSSMALAQGAPPAPPQAAPETTPGAVMPAAPGSPPASTAIDISTARPDNMPRMEERPAATQVVPGPGDPGASAPPTAPTPR